MKETHAGLPENAERWPEPADRSPARARVFIGLVLGWIVLPLFLMADDAGRAFADGAAPAVGALFGIAVGSAIGISRLEWGGLIGLFVGFASAAALPYVLAPPLLGFAAPDPGTYAEYGPVAVAAAIAAAVALPLAERCPVRVRLPPTVVCVVGFTVLVLWVVGSALWAQTMRQQ